MDLWTAFSDEISKLAGAVKFHNKELKREWENRKYENRHTRHLDIGRSTNAKLNEGAGTGQTFRTPEEVEKYRAGIRQHLSKPEVAARVSARRTRLSPSNIKVPASKGKLMQALSKEKRLGVGGLIAGLGGGYFLGKHIWRRKTKKEGSTNESAGTSAA